MLRSRSVNEWVMGSTPRHAIDIHPTLAVLVPGPPMPIVSVDYRESAFNYADKAPDIMSEVRLTVRAGLEWDFGFHRR